MFDVTLTDKDFKKDFVHQDADWLAATRPAEPDLEVDGLSNSLLARLFAFLSGARNVAR